MLRPERLEFRNWWTTLGQWGPANAVLQRFDKDSQAVLKGQVANLLNQLVRVDAEFDPRFFIQKILPVAAEGVTAKQFAEGLELASRLGDAGIDPTQTLQYGLPALAQNATSQDAFRTNLLYLEALITHLRERQLDTGKAFFVAIRAAAKELDTRQLTTTLVLATRLAEMGIDPCDTIRFAIPSASHGLTDQQFRLAITLANHYVRRRCGISELLGKDLPDVARAIAPEQLTAGLRLAIHLEERKIVLKNFFKSGLRAIVKASEMPEDFTVNLDFFGKCLTKLKQQHLSLDPPVTAMASRCEAADDFRHNIESLYRFCVKMVEHKIVPDSLLRYGFPPTVSHTPETFQSTLQNLTTVIVRLREAGVNDHLMAYIVEFGLPRVAKNSTTPDEFRNNLLVLMKSFRQLAIRDIDPDCHRKAFESIDGSRQQFSAAVELLTAPELLEGGLATIYELAASAHFDWRNVRPTDVKELTTQAIDLTRAERKFSITFTTEGPKIDRPLEGHAAFRSRVRGTQPAKET